MWLASDHSRNAAAGCPNAQPLQAVLAVQRMAGCFNVWVQAQNAPSPIEMWVVRAHTKWKVPRKGQVLFWADFLSTRVAGSGPRVACGWPRPTAIRMASGWTSCGCPQATLSSPSDCSHRQPLCYRLLEKVLGDPGLNPYSTLEAFWVTSGKAYTSSLTYRTRWLWWENGGENEVRCFGFPLGGRRDVNKVNKYINIRDQWLILQKKSNRW